MTGRSCSFTMRLTPEGLRTARIRSIRASNSARSEPSRTRAKARDYSSSGRFENLWIDFAEEIGVKPLNGRRSVLFIDDKAEIDVGGAVRDHQDIDVRKAAERAAGDAGRVFQVT